MNVYSLSSVLHLLAVVPVVVEPVVDCSLVVEGVVTVVEEMVDSEVVVLGLVVDSVVDVTEDPVVAVSVPYVVTQINAIVNKCIDKNLHVNVLWLLYSKQRNIHFLY